jgi:hypothetical protein
MSAFNIHGEFKSNDGFVEENFNAINNKKK